MSSTSSGKTENLERFGLEAHVLVLLVLACAHVPGVAVQWRTLWGLEYYQFFPFAFAAFAWLFYSRCQLQSFSWNHICSLLVGCDLVLLAIGAYLPSPQAVYVGMLLLTLAVCLAYSDAQYKCSLGYLFLLPLITLRPPLLYDEKAIHWLQVVTTRIASRMLNRCGFMHLRDGNTLEFPGKRFLVEEACSGVQSLFTVLFLATLIICGYRRKWLHSLLVLAVSFCIAGIMNVLRICAISVAWSRYSYDLSVGWQHDLVGYLALIMAAALVFSADSFWYLVFAYVPDQKGVGLSSVFRNPFIAVWNKIFVRSERASSSDVTREQLVSSSRGNGVLLAGATLVCISAVAGQLLRL